MIIMMIHADLVPDVTDTSLVPDVTDNRQQNTKSQRSRPYFRDFRAPILVKETIKRLKYC